MNDNLAPQGTQSTNYNPSAPAGAAGSLDPTISQPTPSTPAPNVNAGRTAVTLGNGSTVYYDKSGQAYDATGNLVSNASIAVSTIGNTVPPPAGSTGPAPVPATAPTAAEQFHTSLATTIDTQRNQLNTSYKQQVDKYQSQIDSLNQEKADAQNLADLGISTLGSTTAKETQDKQAALDQERAQFQSNFDARQKLVDTLSTLLSTGQQAIAAIKGTSGMSSIMNARVAETMANVQGQAGVITTALAAYDSQIGLAQAQLRSATDAITSIYGDQLTYWKNVAEFYSGRAKDITGQVTSLSKDQQAYVDAQIKMQQDQIANTQKTADAIQAAMLDPKTALSYAKAGVSLTDSPEQIAQKLAVQAQADAKQWSAPYTLGKDTVQRNIVTGEIRTVVGSTSPTPTSSTNAKGQMSNKDYVEISLQRAKLSYSDALAKVPAGKIGVVDNASGQIGYIDPTEFNTKQYTKL